MRNRVIEYLELASSFDAQRAYEVAAPIAHVPHEVIEQWRDWVPVDPRTPGGLSTVYSPEEALALRQYEATWDRAVDLLPDLVPPLRECQRLPAWLELQQAAQTALSAFETRGRLSDDEEC